MRDQCGIRCTRHLAHWCSHVGQVERLLFQLLPMRPTRIVLANLRAAWEAASHRESYQALQTQETGSVAEIDDNRHGQSGPHVTGGAVGCHVRHNEKRAAREALLRPGAECQATSGRDYMRVNVAIN